MIKPQEADSPYTFRPYTLDDIPFIHSSWGDSYYGNNGGYQQLTFEEFQDRYHRPIRNRILDSKDTAIIVACAKDLPEHILGYIVLEDLADTPFHILHYVYVKQAFKGQRIATELMDRVLHKRPVLFTHQTQISKRIITNNWRAGKGYFERFIYTPHLT